MDFFEVLDRVVDLLRSRGRVTYGALKLQFQLDDAQVEVLKDELIYAQHLAVGSQRIVDMRVRGAMTPPVRQELWAPNVSMLRSFHIAERSSAPKIARLERHGSTIFLIRNCQGMWLDRYFGRF